MVMKANTMKTALEIDEDEDDDTPVVPTKFTAEDLTDYNVGVTNGDVLVGENGVEIIYARITPEMALEILTGRNIKNRRMKSPSVLGLAKAMTDGYYSFVGTSIVFGDDGSLLDGQHRLSACVESGVPFDTLVVFNVDKRLQRVIDNGAKRTAGQAAYLEGVENSQETMTATAYIARFRETSFSYESGTGERFQILDKHPKLVDHVKKVRGVPTSFSRGMIAALSYVLTEIMNKPAHAEKMISLLSLGGVPGKTTEGKEVIWSDPKEPMLRLRERVFSAKEKRARLQSAALAALTITALNHQLGGRTVGSIVVPKEFPRIDGLDVSKL